MPRERKSVLRFFIMGFMIWLCACAGCVHVQQKDSNRSQPAQRHQPNDVVAENGMVAAAHPLAVRAGLEILQKGGNAVDAAVATGFAIGVVEPMASGIGGSGYILIHTKDGENIAIDARGMAPAYVDAGHKRILCKSCPDRHGAQAVLVPGLLSGYEKVLQRYGTLPLSEIVKPAIRLAEQGFACTDLIHRSVNDNYEWILKNNESQDVPFLKDGLPVAAGETITMPKLAKAFKLIGEKGISKAFYKGPIGRSMVQRLNTLGSRLSLEDLQGYEALVRQPVTSTYRGYPIISMPPSSSGGATVIETLNILETFPVRAWTHNSIEHIHHLRESFRIAFADRMAFLADPDFNAVPLDMLISKKYAFKRAAGIDPHAAMKKIPAGNPEDEHWSTTHFSVADADGNIVAITQTLVSFFGAQIIDPEYGFWYNNSLVSFTEKAASINATQPGKRPRSSMSPTLVLDPDGKAFMTLGSPGSSRIINAVVQIISNVIDFGMSIDQAIEAPRIASTKTGKLYLEGHLEDAALKADGLKELGHAVEIRDSYDLYFGGAQAILFKEGKLFGGADSRRDGCASGY